MNRLIMAAFFAAGAAAVLTGVKFLEWGSRGPSRESISRPPTVDPLPPEQEAMGRKSPHAIEPPSLPPPGAMVVRAAGPASTAIVSPETSPLAQLTPEQIQERLAEQRFQRQKYLERLDNMLSGQNRDVQWSGETERAVEKAVAASGTAKLEQATCAESMCKVVVKHEKESDRRPFAIAIAREEPFRVGTQYAYDGLTTTMYFVRAGHKLPDAD